jgi:predicted small metal-binding protein
MMHQLLRWTVAIGHYLPHALAAVLMLMWATLLSAVLVQDGLPLTGPGAGFSFDFLIAITIACAASLSGIWVHGKAACPACTRRAHCGPTEAASRRVWLRIYHLVEPPPGTTSMLRAFIAPAVLAAAALMGIWFFPLPALIYLPLGALIIYTRAVHHFHVLWCNDCITTSGKWPGAPALHTGIADFIAAHPDCPLRIACDGERCSYFYSATRSPFTALMRYHIHAEVFHENPDRYGNCAPTVSCANPEHNILAGLDRNHRIAAKHRDSECTIVCHMVDCGEVFEAPGDRFGELKRDLITHVRTSHGIDLVDCHPRLTCPEGRPARYH